MDLGSNHDQTMLLETIWMVAVGSRGDIEPYIAVGASLVQRGYRVTFLTYDSYAAFAETVGMRGIGLGTDYEKSIQKTEKIERGMKEGDALLAFSGIAEMNRKNAPTLCQAFLKEIEESGVPDLCLAMPFGQYLAWYLYIHRQVPFLQVTTFAFAYNPNHMLLGLPKLPFHLTYYILHHLFVGGAYDGFKAYEDYLDSNVLKVFTKSKYIAYYKQPMVPMLTLLSPVLASALYSKDISPMWRFVGSTVIPTDQQVNNLEYYGGDNALKQIETFLNAAPERKPVYLGWGSMLCKSSEHMVELCCRAVQHAGQRAIVLGGAASLSFDILLQLEPEVDHELIDYARENILFVDYAPHEWLFPRIAATVHHGGAGTTTAAMRGGVPTIITPVFGDQFDFSYVVRELGVGVGFSKQFQKIDWRELGDAIRLVVADCAMATKAAALGNMLRKEDGANNAVVEIEKYWRDYCGSETFHRYFPRQEDKKQSTALKQIVPVMVIVAAVLASYGLAVSKK